MKKNFFRLTLCAGLVGVICFLISMPIRNVIAKRTQNTASSVVSNEYLIVFKDEPDLAIVANVEQLQSLSITPALRNANAGPGFSYLQSRLFVATDQYNQNSDDLIKRLSADPRIARVEQNYAVYLCDQGGSSASKPNDPYRKKEQWNLDKIGMKIAWKFGTVSKRGIIVNTDTGVNYTHPDLLQNLWWNYREVNGLAGVDDDRNGYVDDFIGYNFLADTNDPNDDNGHGSWTDGIMGAAGNNGEGMTGINWQCEIAAAKFIGPAGSGKLSDALKALQYAAVLRVSTGRPVVINASWGLLQESQILKDAIIALQPLDIGLVAAAGNYGTDFPLYPAGYDLPNTIGVAASDRHDKMPWFSERGIGIDLAAPGDYVFSAYKGGGYLIGSGTSASAPHVTGVINLLYAFPGVDWATAKRIVIESADKLPDFKKPRTTSGGRLNAGRAMRMAAELQPQ